MIDPTNPIDMSDDELEKRYRNTWKRAVGNYSNDAEASLLSYEMNRRLIATTTRNSHLWTKISLGVSFFALIFASTSVVFSYIDWSEDTEWQKKQIGLLRDISGHIASLSVAKKDELEELSVKGAVTDINSAEPMSSVVKGK